MKITIVVWTRIFALILFLCRSDTAFGDSLYQEGFVNLQLPGGSNDPRKEPNLPLFVDTSRYNDGFSSSSAFDSNSPSFPSYSGNTANVSQRYRHYIDYVLSAKEQGIATYGAGDEEKEAARIEIISQLNFTQLPNPTKTFTVYAPIKWNPSDFAIQTGETYNITVFGSQYWYDGGIRVNSQGYSSYFDSISNCYVGMGRCRPHLKRSRRLASANWMSLVCAIGQFVRPLTEIKPGDESKYRWMPLDESTLVETLFEVGHTVSFTAVYTGQLICFANDAHSLYWNNKGQLDVTVTRVSWPPSSETVYQELLLPACDSAQVVYANHGNNSYSPEKAQLAKEYPTNPNDTYTKVQCNPKGGGSGWKLSDVLNTQGGYGAGAPESIYYDISSSQRNQ